MSERRWRSGLSARGRAIVGLVLSMLVLALASGLAAKFEPERAYVESEAVARRFPAPSETYATPAFKAGKQDFTSYAELMAFLKDLSARAPHVKLEIIGVSQQGREIPALRFASAVTSERPRVLLIGQQHGNEPAGGEAMLALAQLLAGGRLAELTERLDIVIVPRANTDGAEGFVRTGANGIDINRDHILLRTPEAAALATLARSHAPHLVADFHEFQAAGRWLSALGALTRHDLTIQYATTPNLAPPLIEAQERLFRAPLLKALDAKGFAHDWYYTAGGDLKDRVVSMGGLGADIGRNAAGLRNAVSFLIETRGLGIGRQHLDRRVAAHVAAAEALLKAAAANAAELLALQRAAQEAVRTRAAGTPIVISALPTRETRHLTLLDPKTGLDQTIEISWLSALRIEAKLTRPRPQAYLLLPTEAAAAAKLAAHGLKVETIPGARRVRGEAFLVVEAGKAPKIDPNGIATEVVQGRFRTEPVETTVEAGAFLVPLDQPLANIAHVLLEPESLYGLVAHGVIRVDAGARLPVLRVERID